MMVDKPLSPEITRLTLLLENKPESRLFVPLAEAYIQSDMRDEAVRVLSDGIKNQQSFVAARVMLGKIYLAKKDFSEAKTQFEHVLNIAPSNIPSLKGLASIYQEGGLIQQAREFYQTILKIDPLDKSAEGLLSAIDVDHPPLPDQGTSETTRSENEPLVTALDRQVPEPMATRTLASLYMKQGCYQEAAQVYKKLLQINPSDLESQTRLEQAREHLQGTEASSFPKDTCPEKEKKIQRLQSWLNTIQEERKR